MELIVDDLMEARLKNIADQVDLDVHRVAALILDETILDADSLYEIFGEEVSV